MLRVDPVYEMVMAYFSVASAAGVPEGASVPEGSMWLLMGRADSFVNATTAAIVD